ncbi:glutamate ABC transporter substrate-binding protein [Corynebacterium incognita]|uniref:Glutamate ABC transporter substrate-binding protein n=1 Tax=Corynebacterium incognita TaxID=2754725 RepID=A0A7G7CRI7_9CORY|nr:glutamate ABC transporter substrate-binding protein [Corynebacterium incognita]QNE90203.1 glutamate ABC transporter substrate-binding protein [Corynebacterium incognita]
MFRHLRFTTPRAPLAVGSLLVATSLTLGSCAAPWQDDAAQEERTEKEVPLDSVARPYRPHNQLPAGTRLEAAGVEAPEEIKTQSVTGSLRPDNKKPKERVPHIVERGRLVVGVDQSQNLLSYRDSVSGQLKGFEVDLAHEIAADIFGDRNKVDFRFIQSAEREEALSSGKVDIIIRTMTITEDRQKNVLFSTPYLTTRTRLLVLNNSHITEPRHVAGRRVCVTDASTAQQLARKHAKHANILLTDSWSDCLMALQLGQTDAVLSDDTILSGMAQQDPYARIVGQSLATDDYGVGVAKPNGANHARGTVRQVNSTLERLRRDGTWNELYTKWFGEFLPAEAMPAAHYKDTDAKEEK